MRSGSASLVLKGMMCMKYVFGEVLTFGAFGITMEADPGIRETVLSKIGPLEGNIFGNTDSKRPTSQSKVQKRAVRRQACSKSKI